MMRLADALRINQQPPSAGGRDHAITLACGFTPLHFETFLKASARSRFPGDAVSITSGLFGDLAGNVERAAGHPAEGTVVVIEWGDLDERLALRASAGWTTDVLADVLTQVPVKLGILERGIVALASETPVVVVTPSLALPPLTYLPPEQTAPLELQLRSRLDALLGSCLAHKAVRVVSESALAEVSPPSGRRDVKMELHAGFPYSLAHAAALAELCVQCLFPATPKKGLITDLDDVVWKGVLGDVGVAAVSWSLDGHAQAHGLYQQVLASLAETGVLVAVASKNDHALVREAFARPDMLLREEQVFPIEAHWGAKSESVGRILKAWNIAPDSVVFVDDSPMELAEVGARFPEMECLQFPVDPPTGILDLLGQLRARFGKAEIREEDRLRLQSLRASASIELGGGHEASADFLSRLEAELTLEFTDSHDDPRAFELVNKTNQFNLNGERYSEGEWRAYFAKPGAFLLTAAYRDRYGSLGKIAVLGGRKERDEVRIDLWVMSCRAFSRHIEFQVLRYLYSALHTTRFALAFRPTQRNGPLQDFLGRFFPDGLAPGTLDLPMSVFDAACPRLFHQVIEAGHGQPV